MQFDTIIAGGRLVTADRVLRADLGVHGEKIVAIEPQLAQKHGAGARVIDARGRYVIPGGIDAHVHLDLPVGKTVSADDFDSGTRAAACGGVTTVIDFATPQRDETLQQALEKWHARADGKACVDYSFHMCITNWRKQKKGVRRIIDQGIPTFKQYMIYAERGLQSDDADIFEALETLRDLGGMLCVHAESGRVLDLLVARHHNAAEMRKHGAYLHALTRPNFIEAEAIERAIHWARVTGGPLFIVHVSTAEGAELVKRARNEGVNVLAETCAHYLALDDSVLAGKDGHLYATSPQVKKPRDQQRLWKGLKGGEICSVSTDTCTFTRKQKAAWKGDWTKIPMGMPGLETLLPIVYTHGVLKRRLTISQFVDKCCTAPARVMGLYPRKGTLRVGSDADIVVFHPTRKRKVDWRKMQTNCDWSPYQGWDLAGFAEHT
ncbi:MAG: dihydropyrimidinase, partial [Planctomycetes bacterium]|nr:dihydropyrimidinase [Planctomycetota bacterium]